MQPYNKTMKVEIMPYVLVRKNVMLLHVHYEVLFI